MPMETLGAGGTVEVHVKDPYQNPKDRLGINKVPLHLIPMAAQIHEAMAMWQGGVKYDPFNWRGKKVVASIYIAAAKRHIDDWYDGATWASDGFHHLGHGRACLGILLDAEATGNLIDDRPPAGAGGELLEAFNTMLASINKVMDAGTGTNIERMALVDWAAQRDVYYAALTKAKAARTASELAKGTL